LSDSSENDLEQKVIAAQKRAAAVGEQLDKLKTALREGKRLPISANPPDFPSLKARIAALLTIDEDMRRLLEEAGRIANQTGQSRNDPESN
jgi:hypothetical protein